MYRVLAYDVVVNRRRTRFHKRLKRHLVPVQKSVFAGDLPASGQVAVERLILRELDLETDVVHLLSLCRACRGLIQTWGPVPILGPATDPIIT